MKWIKQVLILLLTFLSYSCTTLHRTSTSCETKITALNKLSATPAMNKIWIYSYGSNENPLPDFKRRETLSFVLKRGSTYSIRRIKAASISSCRFQSVNFVVPPNAVALLHTHPYGYLEKVNDPACPRTAYMAFAVSEMDTKTVKILNMPMYIMDKDWIHIISPLDPDRYIEHIDRCGY